MIKMTVQQYAAIRNISSQAVTKRLRLMAEQVGGKNKITLPGVKKVERFQRNYVLYVDKNYTGK